MRADDERGRLAGPVAAGDRPTRTRCRRSDVVWVAEFDLDRLAGAADRRHSIRRRRCRVSRRRRAISRCSWTNPCLRRRVRGTIRSQAPATLVSIVEFDRYQGKGIPEGKVSLALRFTFQSLERTLTDAEVEAATTAVVELLASELGATRR